MIRWSVFDRARICYYQDLKSAWPDFVNQARGLPTLGPGSFPVFLRRYDERSDRPRGLIEADYLFDIDELTWWFHDMYDRVVQVQWRQVMVLVNVLDG